MTGGSLDYVCYRVDDAIDSIEKRATTTLQKAFAQHLKDVSKALHDFGLLEILDSDNRDSEKYQDAMNLLQEAVEALDDA